MTDQSAQSQTTAVRRRLIRAILRDWTCRNCGWLHLGVWRAVACDCCGFDIRYSVGRQVAVGAAG